MCAARGARVGGSDERAAVAPAVGERIIELGAEAAGAAEDEHAAVVQQHPRARRCAERSSRRPGSSAGVEGSYSSTVTRALPPATNSRPSRSSAAYGGGGCDFHGEQPAISAAVIEEGVGARKLLWAALGLALCCGVPPGTRNSELGTTVDAGFLGDVSPGGDCNCRGGLCCGNLCCNLTDMCCVNGAAPRCIRADGVNTTCDDFGDASPNL